MHHFRYFADYSTCQNAIKDFLKPSTWLNRGIVTALDVGVLKFIQAWFLLMNQSKRLTELSAWIVQLISKWFLTHYYRLTLVTTEKTAIMLRISSHAPMLCAFAATGLRNWVVNFQASTRTSKILFIRASRGASGKEATNRVMKPNWITAKQRWDDMFLHIKTSYSAICE